MKKIIVFGGTGTLGLPICRHLKEKGYDVFAIGYKENNEAFFNSIGINYLSVDITVKEQFDKLPKEDVYCVLNFAGCLPAMMKDTDSNTLYPDTIIRGTINILDYMNSINCRKFIFPQSVYDVNYLFGSPEPISADAQSDNPLTGDHSIYVICKNAAINIIKYYENTYNIKTIVLRLPGVYQYHPKPYILVNGKKSVRLERVLIEKAKRGETLEIWGDCKRVLESVCMEDFLQIVEKSVIANDISGIFNVGAGGVSLEDKIIAIRDVFSPKENPSKIVYCPEKSDSTQFVLDIEKTKNILGYSPKYNWKKYLEKLKWHMENQPNKDVWGSFDEYYDLLNNIHKDSDRFE